MSQFQNDIQLFYQIKLMLDTVGKIDLLLNEGVLREQTPLEAKSTLHGEADQELLNYEKKTLRKLKRTYLLLINAAGDSIKESVAR
jgi:hypothetical protein